jgi:hypothetical protein
MKALFPKQIAFFDLLRDLDDQSKKIAALLADFFGNFKDFETYAKRAKEIEHEADKKSHEIVEKLNKTFITPIDREDIYELTKELDDVVDLIENVIRDIHMYGITEKIDAMDEFAPIIVEASQHLGQLIDCLQDQKHTQKFLDLVIKIHGLEDQGDIAFGKAITKLFKEETDHIKVVKLKDIIEGLEQIMDQYQAVSDTVEGIIVKSS